MDRHQAACAPMFDVPAMRAAAAGATPRWMRAGLHWPFDLMRVQHANAVRAGWLPRSMLASRDFERSLDSLERLALGPYARRV